MALSWRLRGCCLGAPFPFRRALWLTCCKVARASLALAHLPCWCAGSVVVLRSGVVAGALALLPLGARARAGFGGVRVRASRFDVRVSRYVLVLARFGRRRRSVRCPAERLPFPRAVVSSFLSKLNYLT